MLMVSWSPAHCQERECATANIPVVVVTSSAEDPDINAAYTLGANSYVVKPVAVDAFLRVTAEIGFYWLLVNRTA